MADMAKYPAVRELFARAIGDPPHRGDGKRVAEAVGVKEPTVTRWRKGEARPGSEYWAGLARALGVTEREIRVACGGLSEREMLGELLRAVESLAAEVAEIRSRLDGLPDS